MNVLIIEDDVSATRIITEIVAGQNHRVETVHTGKDALKKVLQKKFDLVLLDICLPDCMGYELIPQLKAKWHDIGIVTMTGYNSKELELKVRQNGIAYYLIKPFSVKEIKEILDHTIKKERG
jgi:DNA-binding response OmpR family regulator